MSHKLSSINRFFLLCTVKNGIGFRFWSVFYTKKSPQLDVAGFCSQLSADYLHSEGAY